LLLLDFFLFISLRVGLVLKVLRKETNRKRQIVPGGGPGASFGAVWNWNNKPLNLAGGRPSMKTLSAHAIWGIWALGWVKEQKCITESQY
jgi:hypothetical protein